MALDEKVRRLPLSLEQQKLRDENLRRLREFAKLPPEERPAPVPRDLVVDFKPTPLRIPLFNRIP